MESQKITKRLYLFAFLLPFVIAFVICMTKGVYPFGENCILHVDMYHQYEPFFTELLDKLKNGGSLLYSFRLGLGSDFVALFAYYLASPFNWLLVFCPSSHVIEFMTLLILVKIGLCGLAFAVYLRNHFRCGLEGAFFAAFYALSGYMAAYSWNIMWLDCVWLAPLAILGLERLVKDGKYKLYCISLAFAVLSNFYLAFMLCIFLVLWFVILFFEEKNGIRKKVAGTFRFAVFSLLAGGMGAVLIVPEAIILSYSGSSGFSFPKETEWYFDLVSMLARHCFSVEPHTGNDHWPNLYCGILAFLFLFLYVLNRRICLKKKIACIALVILFWVSFANNILDFIWHGLHFPDSLPGRQVYLYVFLLLVMAYEVYQKQRGNSSFDILAGALLTAVFLAVAAYRVDSGMVTGSALLFTGIMSFLYGFLLLLSKVKAGSLRLLSAYCLAAFVLTELSMNFAATGLSTTSRTAYTKNWESVKGLLKTIEEKEVLSEDTSMPYGDNKEIHSFYRVEEMERLTKNDAAIYGYSSATIFSSLMNIGVSRFYRDLGMEGGKNFYSYSGATPLPSAMLSVKYLIAGNPYEESPLRKLVAGDGTNYIYENLYTLPLGFMVDADLEARWNVKKKEPIANLNRLAAALGVEEELLFPANAKVDLSEDKTRITVYEDCYLYGTYTDTSVKNITVKNNYRERRFSKCDHGYILDLGWCEKGDVLEITNASSVSEFSVKAYGLNMDTLRTAYEELNAQTMVLDEFSDTRIRGHIQVEKAGNLIVSIPQEEGFHIYVDGEKAESGIFMDSMIEIPLIRGEHQITLEYQTPGLLAGAGISLACLILFLGICFFDSRKIIL